MFWCPVTVSMIASRRTKKRNQTSTLASNPRGQYFKRFSLAFGTIQDTRELPEQNGTLTTRRRKGEGVHLINKWTCQRSVPQVLEDPVETDWDPWNLAPLKIAVICPYVRCCNLKTLSTVGRPRYLKLHVQTWVMRLFVLVFLEDDPVGASDLHGPYWTLLIGM